jgi:drug/metabolite transporter (DMT)-like permease
VIARPHDALTSVAAKRTFNQGDEVNCTYSYICVSNLLFSAAIVAGTGTSLALPPWQAILAIAICGPAGTYLLLWAQRMTDLSRLAPLGYSRLVMNAVFA